MNSVAGIFLSVDRLGLICFAKNMGAKTWSPSLAGFEPGVPFSGNVVFATDSKDLCLTFSVMSEFPRQFSGSFPSFLFRFLFTLIPLARPT